MKLRPLHTKKQENLRSPGMEAVGSKRNRIFKLNSNLNRNTKKDETCFLTYNVTLQEKNNIIDVFT